MPRTTPAAEFGLDDVRRARLSRARRSSSKPTSERQLGADAAVSVRPERSRCSICRARRRTRRRAAHPFGTDDRGRDVLVRLAYGFNISMTFAHARDCSSATRLGIAVGAALGYFGGKLDILGQRGIEIWSSLPFLYTIIIISSIVVPVYLPGRNAAAAAVVLAARRHPRGVRLDGHHLLRPRRVLSREGQGLRRRRHRHGRVRRRHHVQAHPAERADAGRLLRAVHHRRATSARSSRSTSSASACRRRRRAGAS